jgi:alpha-tubulin suppressor-like RCC1 family protein
MGKSYSGYKNRGFLLACLVTLVSFFGVIATSGTSLATTPQIAAGDYHTVALKSDGTVWAWGYNSSGQLGESPYTIMKRTTPAQVSSKILNSVTAVAAGSSHTIALRSDGTVLAWGHNSYGQLGDGTTTWRDTPVQVSGLSGVTAIAGGTFYTVALKLDGTVWAWGDNSSGQLGDGTTTNKTTPVQVTGLSGIAAIAVGGGEYGYHTVALKSDATVWAWGWNYYGQLGDGTTTDRYTPVQVSDLSGVTAIASGWYHTAALKSDGTVWAWGNNGFGQLGDGTTTNRYIPVQMSSLSGIAAIAVGGGEYGYHTVALKSDGTVWTWGSNFNETTRQWITTPVQVSGLGGVAAIAAGKYHTVALKSDGTVWAWGINNYGQLGNGTTTNSATPVQVSGLNLYSTTTPTPTPATSPTPKSSPTPSSTPTPTSPASTTPKISAGDFHTMALKSDGTVWAWGNNGFGQLGDGTTTERHTPVKVSGLSGVIAIACGSYHSLAMKSDGTVWAWGYNYYGQLGDGTNTEKDAVGRKTPVKVSSLSGVTAIAGGTYHSLALKSNGTVWAWGYNSKYGQLGDGTNTDRNTPVQVSSLSGVTAIAGGSYHSLSLKSNETVWAWGNNSVYGQLGDGTYTDRNTPVQVSSLSGITAIAGGYSHSLALKSDGTVWAWGNNGWGQLGDGTGTNSNTPVQVSGINLGVTTTTPTPTVTSTPSSEKGSISGDITDTEGYPIESAKIRLKGKRTKVSKKTTSDEYGFFEFTDLSADTYTITATRKGYKKGKQVVTLGQGEDANIAIEMKKR